MTSPGSRVRATGTPPWNGRSLRPSTSPRSSSELADEGPSNLGTLEVGARVRLRNDPGRVGVVLPKIREQGSLRKRQISFPEGVQYVPEDQLEPVQEGGDDPLDLLERGRLADALDLRRTL